MNSKLILQCQARQLHRFLLSYNHTQLSLTRYLYQQHNLISKTQNQIIKSSFFNSSILRYSSTLCKNNYEKWSDETLDALSEFFEDIDQNETVSQEFDVVFESGVLTITVSKSIGTYVINKQAPNKQIWLSSPISGPKRYDLIDNSWIYLHDKTYMHELLESEFSTILNSQIDMSGLPYYKSNRKV